MKSFDEIYDKLYQEHHEELEKLRKHSGVRLLFFTLIVIFALVIFGMILLICMVDNTDELSTAYIIQMAKIVTIFPYIFFIFFSVLVIVEILFSKKVKRNEDNIQIIYKEKIVKEFLKNIDENLIYNPKSGIEERLYKLGEFKSYNIYRSEDSITGKLDNKYNLQMAEVYTASTDSDGSSYTQFHGIFGVIECCKDINTKIKIRTNATMADKTLKKNEKIEMDSAEFEKYFDIYAENKIVAMQILTSDVMALMIDFIAHQNLPYKVKYELTINRNKIYIRFHTYGMFEPMSFNDAMNKDVLKRECDVIEFILNVSREINKAIEKAEI